MEDWISIAEFPPTPIGIPVRIYQFDATVAKLTILHPLYTILKFPPAHSVLRFMMGGCWQHHSTIAESGKFLNTKRLFGNICS